MKKQETLSSKEIKILNPNGKKGIHFFFPSGVTQQAIQLTAKNIFDEIEKESNFPHYTKNIIKIDRDEFKKIKSKWGLK